MMETKLSLMAGVLYLACAMTFRMMRPFTSGLTVVAWLLHGLSLGMMVFSQDSLRLGFALMLSCAMWVSVFVYWMENRDFSLEGLKLLLLPNAAVMSLLPIFFPGQLIPLSGKTAMFPWHIGVALIAYSTLTIAAFHAMVMVFQEAHLHQKKVPFKKNWLYAALERLPALLTMEKILFRLVLIGFVLLSLTVLSGVIFSEQVLGVAFKWDHKTLLSLLSWSLFAILLAGRQWRGWRGKTVLRITLGGFIALLMAYVGSRFVLEVILHRGLS